VYSVSIMRTRRWPGALTVLATSILVSACNAAIPELSLPTAGQVSAADPATSTLAPPTAANGTTSSSVLLSSPLPSPAARTAQKAPGVVVIKGFTGPTVTLFTDETANAGERVLAGSLALPLPSRVSPVPPGRLEIQTEYGARWVARAEVRLADTGAPPASRP
jgi:hypothetical protein